LHEALLLLFRNRPSLAPDLLRDVLHLDLPHYSEVRLDSSELVDLQPAQYRADLVILLLDGLPVLGIVVEVQLGRDEDKRYSWPMYVAGLRARFRCPVCLLVVTADDAMARWSSRSIELGGGNRFTPLVLGPSGVPEVVDETRAQDDPELAVLSAMAHGRDTDTDKAVRIAAAAITASIGLDAERSTVYFDLIVASLSEVARKALQSMDPAKYEYQSEFAKRYLAQGEAKGEARGEARGRATLLLKQLALRFGSLPDESIDRVRSASIEELDRIAERILTANSIEEVLGSD